MSLLQVSSSMYLVSIVALGDVVNSLGSSLDLISILVRDLDRELLLNSHDNLDSVQRVQLEIIVEVGRERDLRLNQIQVKA